MPLNQLQSFIQKNKHLPEIPTSAEVDKEGISLSKMVTLQMKKIEEMTLYILELENRLTSLEKNQKKLWYEDKPFIFFFLSLVLVRKRKTKKTKSQIMLIVRKIR